MIPSNLAAATGAWSGTKRLYLHGEEPRVCPSTATVASAAQDKFCTVAYTWEFEGQPQDGLLVVGQAGEGELSIAWVDSWHMGDKLMLCQGAGGGELSARGSYQMEGYPEWGWRIALHAEQGALRVLMYNISPEGQEYPAVEAEYTRAADAAGLP